MSIQAKRNAEPTDGLLDKILMNTLGSDLSQNKQPKFNYKGIYFTNESRI